MRPNRTGIRSVRSGRFFFISSFLRRCHLIQPPPALAARWQHPIQPIAGVFCTLPTAFHAAPNRTPANGAARAHHAGQLVRASTSPASHLLRLQRSLRRCVAQRQLALLLWIVSGTIDRTSLAVVAAVCPVHVSSPPPATATPARRTGPESRSARTSLRARGQTRIPPP